MTTIYDLAWKAACFLVWEFFWWRRKDHRKTLTYWILALAVGAFFALTYFKNRGKK